MGAVSCCFVDRSAVEQGLVDGAARLSRVHDEIADIEDRLGRLRSEVEDLRLRSIASETPLATDHVVEAQVRLQALVAAHAALSDSMLELRESQNRLLDQLPKP